jgi:hypothetical protein
MDRFLLESGPEDLQPLAELAFDLRNCWDHSIDPLWSRIEPELWCSPTIRGSFYKRLPAQNSRLCRKTASSVIG